MNSQNLGRRVRPLTIKQTMRWSYLAHLTAVLNPFTAILGVAAALGLYLVVRRRSPLVAFHALQALLMQLALWVGGGLVTIGLMTLANFVSRYSGYALFIWPLAFFAALFPLGSAVYGAYGALVTRAGEEFKYYRAGDLALRILQAQEARSEGR